MFKTFSLIAASFLLLVAGGASATPADDARTHFQAVAAGNLQIVMRG